MNGICWNSWSIAVCRFLHYDVAYGSWDMQNVKDQAKCPWKIHPLIDEIRQILQQFQYFQTRHVYREVNCVTNYVASLGHFISSHQEIDPYIDSKFFNFLFLDKIGHILEKRQTYL